MGSGLDHADAVREVDELGGRKRSPAYQQNEMVEPAPMYARERIRIYGLQRTDARLGTDATLKVILQVLDRLQPDRDTTHAAADARRIAHRQVSGV